MSPSRLSADHSFHIDQDQQCIWIDGESRRLRAKSFAVLLILQQRAGEVVTKEELLTACWDGATVQEEAIKGCIREIRQVFGDAARSPTYIQTEHGRGYRFIGPVASNLSETPIDRESDARLSSVPARPMLAPSQVVGRSEDLAVLDEKFEDASRGMRQVLFITGEPGIGKTTLVDAFVLSLNRRQPVSVVRGQCIDLHGVGEPYRPVLEALSQLRNQPNADDLIEYFRDYAPMWLAHLPTFLPPDAITSQDDLTRGTTQTRMLREFIEVLDLVTAEQPMVLILEDLHWSDNATLDLIALLARRREPARLLILGTYRPVDMHLHHEYLQTLTDELYIHQLGTELALSRLSEEAVSDYLQSQGLTPSRVATFGPWIYGHTEGQPLFMEGVVRYLKAQGWWDGEAVDERSPQVVTWSEMVPRSVKQLTELYWMRLDPDDQEVLEVCSVAGVVFPAAVIARTLQMDLELLEKRCTELARMALFLKVQAGQVCPDGTVTTRYEFHHALYQQAIYLRVSDGQRIRLHRRIAENAEALYGDQGHEIAAELALHFERGLDYNRALQYYEYAAINAMRRCAYKEAIVHLRHGLHLLSFVEERDRRRHYELTFNVALGPALVATQGWGAAEVEQTYARAQTLCDQLGTHSQSFAILHGLWTFRLVRAELGRAREVSQRLLEAARGTAEPAQQMIPNTLQGGTLFYHGEFADAQSYFERGLQLYQPQRHQGDARLYGQDFKVTGLSFSAWTRWFWAMRKTLASSWQPPSSMRRHWGIHSV